MLGWSGTDVARERLFELGAEVFDARLAGILLLADRGLCRVVGGGLVDGNLWLFWEKLAEIRAVVLKPRVVPDIAQNDLAERRMLSGQIKKGDEGCPELTE